MTLGIITGGSLGLGFQTAAGLLSHGVDVVLTSRDKVRGEKAKALLEEQFPNREVSFLELDLSRTESVNGFAYLFARGNRTWDILINNAGAKVLKRYQETDSGCEYHFGVNAVGHFAITVDLMPHKSESARVVSVSSIVAGFAPKVPGPQGSKEKNNPGESYAASKLSNLLFALELERRFGSEGFKSVAAHPGFARAEPYGNIVINLAETVFAQSAAAGSQPIVAAALGSIDGSYITPQIFQLWGRPKASPLPKIVTLKKQKENWAILSDLANRDL